VNVSTCEVAVIGGGLAGNAAAISLARTGVDVALFEAGTLPRHRVCGEFLSPESRTTLSRLGLESDIASAGARAVDGARFLCDGAHADFSLGEGRGIALSRYALDPLMWSATQNAGVRAHLETKVRDLQSDGDTFTFATRTGNWRARSIILAAGRPASPKPDADHPQPLFCGLKAHFSGVDLEEGVVEMHLFRGGYCGLVRVEGEATNACLMVEYAQLRKSPPEAFWARLLSENPTLRARFRGAMRLTPWVATAGVSFERFRPVGDINFTDNGLVPDGTLCAGDAAGYIHPLTGDGMAMALRAGELAATVARLRLQGLSRHEAARLYRAAWMREFAPRLQLATRLHPLALRPQWARPLLPILQRFPALCNMMVRGTRGAMI
jgi:flavin-dependent dehydrogenase